MTEETLKHPERTPEEQAAYDKDMKTKSKLMMVAAPREISSQVAFCLADMVRAVIEGRLKPEDIPPTAEELLVITYGAVARKMLDNKLRGMLGGLQ